MGSFEVRILTILIQTIMALIFLYLGRLIIKRDKKRLNVLFSMYYFFIVLGTVFNWFYAFLNPELSDIVHATVLYLNFFTNFFYFGSLGFLLAFNIIVLKSEKVFDSTKQLLYLIFYIGGIGTIMFILIHVPGMGVEFKQAGTSSPFWTLAFFLAVVLFLSACSIGPSIYLLYQTTKHFTDEELKKKYRYFSIGYIEIAAFAYIIAISNFIKEYSPSFPTIALLLGTILVITGAYLMYIGVGKQISK